MPVASGGTFGGIRISASMPEALSLPADAAPVPCPAQDLADKAPGDAVWASGRPASWQRLLLGLALLKRLLDLAHHGRLDLVEVCLDGVATGLRLGSGHRHLLGLGPVDGHSRLGEEAAVQRIDQAVESRIGQRDLLLIVEPSQGHGLMGVPRIRRHLGPEPLQRTEPPRLAVRGEFHDDEMQENLVYQGVTLADRQGCAGVVTLPAQTSSGAWA